MRQVLQEEIGLEISNMQHYRHGSLVQHLKPAQDREYLLENLNIQKDDIIVIEGKMDESKKKPKEGFLVEFLFQNQPFLNIKICPLE